MYYTPHGLGKNTSNEIAGRVRPRLNQLVVSCSNPQQETTIHGSKLEKAARVEASYRIFALGRDSRQTMCARSRVETNYLILALALEPFGTMAYFEIVISTVKTLFRASV